MRIFIWILIIGLVWILLTPNREGLKKPKLKNIKKSIAKVNVKKAITKAANKVGKAIEKVATGGMDANAKKVLKNLGKIKESIRSFTKKGGAGYLAIPIPSNIPLKEKKCGK